MRPDHRLHALIRVGLIVVAGVLVSSRPASAEGCTIAATSINFGAYDVFDSGPKDSTGSLTYECTGGGKLPLQIAMVASGGTAPVLVNGAERLYYNLFQNAARTAVWGYNDGQVYSAPRSKDPVTVPVFGRIPPGQDVAVGAYTGSVTVVLNF